MDMGTSEANPQGQGIAEGMGASNGQSGPEGSMALQMATEGFSRIVADSVSDRGIRLTTFHLRYWRAIHAELMTHRVFSRNARSSRAVPSRVLLTEPIFIPVFGMNQPGMQSDIIAPPELQDKWRREWQDLAAICREYVERWSSEKMHKQHANRPLEWFGWIDVLVTSVYWDNFWTLRISEYAQPEFDQLARGMKQAMDLSKPRLLLPGEWHLPYITDEERESDHPIPLEALLKISTARCARLSYKPFDGQADYDAEVSRHDKLVVSSPVHASPAEHQATPDNWYSGDFEGYGAKWAHLSEHGNLTGWRQYRKMIPSEAVMENY